MVQKSLPVGLIGIEGGISRSSSTLCGFVSRISSVSVVSLPKKLFKLSNSLFFKNV